jgi:ubiquinone/menaquinone biosynthesis C-methylase UbiE
MADAQIVFTDGAAYEKMMGTWSRLAGAIFLDWVAPRSGLAWVDVGCGNGAFTELILSRCAPAEVHGVDPSEGQLAFARSRPGTQGASFHQGDAMALPFPAVRFDAATMALVIFFVPDPAKGLAEMARVVRPGGIIAAYAWDLYGGGFPLEPLQAEMRAIGLTPLRPPRPETSRVEVLRDLWGTTGLQAIETREITVERTFADFDDFWTTSLLGPSIASVMAELPAGDVEALKARVRARLGADKGGPVTYAARANAIKGRVA